MKECDKRNGHISSKLHMIYDMIYIYVYNLGARYSGWSTPRPRRFEPRYPFEEFGWVPRGEGVEKRKFLVPPPQWGSTPDHPGSRKSLHRLSYPGPFNSQNKYKYTRVIQKATHSTIHTCHLTSKTITY